MSPCVLTTYSLTPTGYGRTHAKRFGKTIWRAHVLSWIDAHGRLPGEGMQINHHCDNRACVNVEHLYEGTQNENMQDMADRGRTYSGQLTECPAGHRYEGDNVCYTRSQRVCMACQRRKSERARRRRGHRPQVELRVFTDEQVAELKSRVAAGETKAALAREFSVHPMTVSRWVSR